MFEPNEVRGEWKLTMGGREFILIPRFQQIARIEAGLGRSILQAVASGGFGIADLAMIIDNLAKKQKPPISREEIGDMILEEGMEAVVPVIEMLVTRVTRGSGNRDQSEAGEA